MCCARRQRSIIISTSTQAKLRHQIYRKSVKSWLYFYIYLCLLIFSCKYQSPVLVLCMGMGQQAAEPAKKKLDMEIKLPLSGIEIFQTLLDAMVRRR